MHMPSPASSSMYAISHSSHKHQTATNNRTTQLSRFSLPYSCCTHRDKLQPIPFHHIKQINPRRKHNTATMRDLFNVLPFLWTVADLSGAGAAPLKFAEDDTEIFSIMRQQGSTNEKNEQHRLRFVSTDAVQDSIMLDHNNQYRDAPQRELQPSSCGAQCFSNQSCSGDCQYCNGFVCYNVSYSK
jgi:hypothetical protein